mgnify:CR=1 FL=1
MIVKIIEKIKKIFEADDTLESYKAPILKMIISIIIIILVLISGRLINIDNRVIDIITRLMGAQIIILCILRVYISWSEFSMVQDNRDKKNANYQKFLKMAINISLEKTLSIIFDNDIIGFEILYNEKIINIGASSDSNNGSSKFFDKHYFINDNEFEDFEEFKLKIMEYSTNDMILVARIDEVPAKKYFK